MGYTAHPHPHAIVGQGGTQSVHSLARTTRPHVRPTDAPAVALSSLPFSRARALSRLLPRPGPGAPHHRRPERESPSHYWERRVANHQLVESAGTHINPLNGSVKRGFSCPFGQQEPHQHPGQRRGYSLCLASLSSLLKRYIQPTRIDQASSSLPLRTATYGKSHFTLSEVI